MRVGWGDELIVTGQARVMQETDPRRVRVRYEKPKWHEAFDHNPRLARPEAEGDYQDLAPRRKFLRPYMAAKTPERWTWQTYGPPRGELYFTDEERAFGRRNAGRVVLEPHIKPGASPNKQWGWMRWSKLTYLAQAAGLKVTQLGPPGTALLDGAELIETPTMRQAAAVLANARVAVLPEGGAHHVCAAVGTPAVVIFGGFIAPAVTGYADQVSIFTGAGLGCGKRVHCQCCVQAMAAITPQHVFHNLGVLINEASRRRVVA